MKQINQISFRPDLASVPEDKKTVTETDSLLVNKIITQLLGIFPSMSNTTYQSALVEYKKQLSKALLETKTPVTHEMLRNAFTYLRQKGETFQPSVPEFMKLCSNNKSNAPEHRWFDPSKSLNNFTEEERQANGKKLCADIRQKLKAAKHVIS